MIESASRYPWYEIVEGGQLTQGDIITDCPFVVVDAADALASETGGKDLKADIQIGDMIVLTQACDLENDKVDSVVLCPVWSLPALEATADFFRSTKGKETIRRGESPAYHMLNAFDDKLPVSIVDFHRLHSLPKAYLAAIASARGPRIRLLPPYREHLAQAFARYFMRVGLPVDIPAFRKQN